jgi:carbamoyltransferase
MISWGWSGMAHDASLAVFDDKQLVFAAHAERYSRIKNDKNLNKGILKDALQYGMPDRVYFYERPWLKKSRQLYAGQYDLLKKPSPRSVLDEFYKNPPRVRTTTHHHSHAAGGYFTSSFDDAAILCIDSIGEWETISIWTGEGNRLKKLWSQRYPDSIGIWYSGMTQRIGLKPQEHEYILMGMSAVGDPKAHYNLIKNDFILKMPTKRDGKTVFLRNCHRGCMNWQPLLNTVQNYADIAAGVQRIYEEIFQGLIEYTANITNKKNLVLTGGCVLNCVANPIAHEHFDNVWIMPNPGDAGSSVGCVLAHKSEHIDWPGPYLGHNIKGEYPVEKILQKLQTDRITAVASGRAEFGPRALGNRSILADPRGDDVKDLVNSIKHREAFRPFAPAILEEHASKYFNGYTGPYMQYTATCKDPTSFPAIVHYDNTSRVQTVAKTDNTGFRKLLERWYELTGCPMLLNTSLNIKGEPLVNTKKDAERWSKKYGVDVCTP